MSGSNGVGESEAARILERFRGSVGGRNSNLLDGVGANIGARRARTVAVVAVLVGIAAVLLWQRVGAPTPIEERMPQAVASESATVGNSGSIAEATNGSTGPSKDGAGGKVEESAGVVLVHVAGAVMRPGVVELSSGARVDDAVRAAGGLAPGADPNRVNLAAPLVDGSWIAIPTVGELVTPVQVPTSAPPGGGDTSSGNGGGGEGGAMVDLNTAEAGDLEELPGIGPATAEAIVEHRTTSGPFGSVDDLLEVRGIGEAKLEALREKVTVSGAGAPPG